MSRTVYGEIYMAWQKGSTVVTEDQDHLYEHSKIYLNQHYISVAGTYLTFEFIDEFLTSLVLAVHV